MFKQELNRHSFKMFQIKFACGWILYIIKKPMLLSTKRILDFSRKVRK